MSTYLSAYTINLSDTVETGRTKIDYFVSGDTSPFGFWSGDTLDQRYLSIFRNITNPNYGSNYINYDTSLTSGSSTNNFIANGYSNIINTIGSVIDDNGSFNTVSGFFNYVNGINSNTNIVVGSGNTINPGSFNFINGINNSLYANSVLHYNPSLLSLTNNLIISSEYSILSTNHTEFGNITLSSYNSYLNKIENSNNNIYDENNFISGLNNNIYSSINMPETYGNIFSYIGNGNNNFIIKDGVYSGNGDGFNEIINGENNIINIDYDSNIDYVNLFGSNLTAVSNNYSHFQNLYVDETLMVENYISYGVLGNPDEYLDKNYSYHFVYLGTNNITIHFPIPDNDLQFLILNLKNTSLGGSYNATFSGSISCKYGSVGRYTTQLSPNENVSYFFIWTSTINKWVMFFCDSTSNF